MAIKLDKVTFENLDFEFSIEDFGKDFNTKNQSVELDMVVDASADYTTNASDYFRRAMIGENSTRSLFRQILGVKDRVKLGTAVFDSLIKSGACDFDPSNSDISQKTFEVCPLMVSTSVCVADLEVSFISDQLSKGSNNFNDSFAFMNYFYETLSLEHQEEMEYLTFRGDSTGTQTGANAYLNTCDGLEVKLGADGTVLKPVTPSAITSANVIDKLIEARDAMPTAVKDRGDFTYLLSTNAMEAYQDAISENQASGQYYVDKITPNFQGVSIVKAPGASDNVLIACNLNNLLNIQDLVTDETGYQVVDFFKTKLDRKIGVRTDFKFSPDFVVGEEIYFHIPA